MRGADAEPLQELVGLAGPGQLADAQVREGRFPGQGFGHGLAQSAGGVMVLDHDGAPARLSDLAEDPGLVERRDGIGVDDAQAEAFLFQDVAGFEGLVNGDPGGDRP